MLERDVLLNKKIEELLKQILSESKKTASPINFLLKVFEAIAGHLILSHSSVTNKGLRAAIFGQRFFDKTLKAELGRSHLSEENNLLIVRLLSKMLDEYILPHFSQRMLEAETQNPQRFDPSAKMTGQ